MHRFSVVPTASWANHSVASLPRFISLPARLKRPALSASSGNGTAEHRRRAVSLRAMGICRMLPVHPHPALAGGGERHPRMLGFAIFVAWIFFDRKE